MRVNLETQDMFRKMNKLYPYIHFFFKESKGEQNKAKHHMNKINMKVNTSPKNDKLEMFASYIHISQWVSFQN